LTPELTCIAGCRPLRTEHSCSTWLDTFMDLGYGCAMNLALIHFLNKSRLKSAISTALAFVIAQGIFVSYASFSSSATLQSCLFKEKSDKSSSHAKKTIRFLALLKGALFVESMTVLQSIMSSYYLFQPFLAGHHPCLIPDIPSA
jgi:hypothetical protein